MLFIQNDCLDPAYNLALEEYLLTAFTESVIMLWRNRRSVIIGYNQNALEEVNLGYAGENRIDVVRRLTGGGAVFHDPGNVNFTFIKPFQPDLFHDYDYFTVPIRDYLCTLGVEAYLSGRNDLMIGGCKISGNAQTVKNDRRLHHGTLLFAADLSELANALLIKDIKIASKGIKSVKGRVSNIAPHLQNTLSVEAFQSGLKEHLMTHVDHLREYCLSERDVQSVTRLAAEKYRTWDWNFGKSPPYNLENSCKFSFGIVNVKINVVGGRVEEARISGDFFGGKDKNELEQALTGVRHSTADILRVLDVNPADDYIHSMQNLQLAEMLMACQMPYRRLHMEGI